MGKSNPTCYFICNYGCPEGLAKTDTETVKQVGNPVCPNDRCRNNEKGMPEAAKKEYDRAVKQRAELSATELLHLLATGLRDRVKDVRIKKVTVDNDQNSGELVVETHGGKLLIIQSGDIDMSDADAGPAQGNNDADNRRT